MRAGERRYIVYVWTSRPDPLEVLKFYLDRRGICGSMEQVPYLMDLLGFQNMIDEYKRKLDHLRMDFLSGKALEVERVRQELPSLLLNLETLALYGGQRPKLVLAKVMYLASLMNCYDLQYDLSLQQAERVIELCFEVNESELEGLVLIHQALIHACLHHPDEAKALYKRALQALSRKREMVIWERKDACVVVKE